MAKKMKYKAEKTICYGVYNVGYMFGSPYRLLVGVGVSQKEAKEFAEKYASERFHDNNYHLMIEPVEVKIGAWDGEMVKAGINVVTK